MRRASWAVAAVIVASLAATGCDAILGIEEPIDEGSETGDAPVETEGDVKTDAGAETDARPDADAVAAADAVAETGAETDGAIDVDDVVEADTGCVSHYADEVLADSPLDYWRLDETSGTTAADLGSAASAGTYESTITLGAAGALACAGTAMQTAGGDMRAVAAPFGSLSPFSVELWLSPDTMDTYPDHVAGRLSSTGGWQILYGTSGIRFTRVSVSSTMPDEVATTAPPTGVYTHVVATFDGSTLGLYVNGSFAASAPGTAVLPVTAAPLTVGAPGPGIFTPALHGRFDEIAIYDHALSAARIAAHFAAR